MTLLAILALGFFLGMRHATDSDHVVAITTIVSRERSPRSALWIGALWGLGHSVTILLVGGAIVLCGWVIPPRVGLSMEMSVAVMPKGDGTVEVILGSADHSRRAAEGDWPPAPPLARAPLRSHTEGTQAVTFRVAQGSKELTAWYDAELGKRGFVRRSPTSWERGSERVMLQLQPKGTETVAMVWAEGIAHAADGGAR